VTDPNPPSTAPPLVLVADDEASVREMIALVLRTHGFRVRLCADGVEAMAAIDDGSRIDAALLDLRMPRASGSQVLEHIRRHDRHALLPVVAMSAYNDDQQAREVIAAGADAFLAKPFTVDELTSTIAALLAAS
jgi:CheY-like chemotaxis protein